MNDVTTQVPLYRLKVEYDDMPLNPRTDYDNFGKMICWHSRYELGDKHNFSEPYEFLKRLIDTDNDSLDNLSLNELKELAEKDNIILPLYLYDHSGITISCSHTYPYNDRWDAGQVGWTYASYDDIQKEFGDVNSETIAKAKKLLICEINTYDNYLRGECYGYIIEKSGVEVESCWGFLGDFKEIIAEMKSSVDTEYQHLFDHIDYGCMEYCEEKPSIRKQLTTLKSHNESLSAQKQAKAPFAPELG